MKRASLKVHAGKLEACATLGVGDVAFDEGHFNADLGRVLDDVVCYGPQSLGITHDVIVCLFLPDGALTMEGLVDFSGGK